MASDAPAELRAVFLPRYRGNSYLDLLDSHLGAEGVRVTDVGHTLSSILRGFLRARPQVLHLQWLDAFFVAAWLPIAWLKIAAFCCGVKYLRLRGTRIVWTLHNLTDHEKRSPRLDRFCTRFVLKKADAVIAHCHQAKQQLLDEIGVIDPERIHVIPHGHYRGAYPDDVTREDARRQLGIEGERRVFLFLGQIRRYKGVLDLIAAFRAVEAEDIELRIAGKARDDDLAAEITAAVNADPRIIFDPGFVPDEKIQVYMRACDVVALPYRDILTSGAAVLAMSFARACIAPQIGCLGEVVDDRGGFLYDPADETGLRNALAEAARRGGELLAMGEHNLAKTDAWGWDMVAARTAAVYRGL